MKRGNLGLGAALIILLALPLIYQAAPLEILKLRIFDAFVPSHEPSGYFTVLNITEEDVEAEGGWPIPRERLGEIQTLLMFKGALGVGWVVGFPQPDRLGGDQAFAESLAASSVLAMFENPNSKYPPTTGTVIMGDDIGGYEALGTIQNIPSLRYNQGIVAAPVDVDGLLRRIPLLMRVPDGWVPAFGTQVLKTLVGADTYMIKTNPNGLEEIRVRGLPPVAVDSLGRKWISWIVPRETSLAEMDVKDKFVFIGVTAKGVMPQVSTPAGLLEPHRIQAALAESMLIENSPAIPDYALLVEIALLTLTVALSWLFIHYLGITVGVSVSGLLMAGTAFGGVWVIRQGLLIDVSWSLISEFIAASCAFYLNYREQYKLRQQIKKQFEHYLDPRQVKRLQDDPSLLKLGGEKRYCTFLFTDVRGFTALSESVTPEEVTYIMNRALTAQQNAVAKCHGCVDKYIGDAMMAIFNAPLDIVNHEEWAIQCALMIQENMKELNYEFGKRGLPSVQIGIGINSGEAIIGNMGSDTRFDYTAIGDAVNIAARLESGTKEAGVDILIGPNTAQKSNSKLQSLEPMSFKGKAKKIQVYTLWDLS